jgi:hypothetical protein
MVKNHFVFLLSSTVFVMAAAGCSSSASPDDSPDDCSPDSTLQCAGGATGFSCTGGATPDTSSLTCSTGTDMPDGTTGYCCIDFSGSSSTCSPDDSVSGCESPSYGFSCAGSDTPDETDSSLTCSSGVVASDGYTEFCCE